MSKTPPLNTKQRCKVDTQQLIVDSLERGALSLCSRYSYHPTETPVALLNPVVSLWHNGQNQEASIMLKIDAVGYKGSH